LYALIGVMLSGWVVNLIDVLSRPVSRWQDAIAFPLLVVLVVAIAILVGRSRSTSPGNPLVKGKSRPWLLAMLTATLLAAVVWGFRGSL
jgi:hypothetical protein